MSATPTGYKQTEVGVIPDDWRCDYVGGFVDLLTGFPFPSSGYSASGVRLLRGSNVKRGCTDWSDNLAAYWPSVTSEIKKYVLRSEDIVVAMDGSLVGRSFASLGKDDVPALLLQRVARLRSGSVSQAYLKAWVCSQRFTNHCDLVKTTTAIPHISPADIRSFEIAVPPTKAEQEAIAEALSDADALIESLEQLHTKKRHLKQATMQELLTGKKRLPGFSGEWEVKRLGDVAQLYQPVTISAKQFTESGYPVYGANGVVGFYREFNHEKSQVTVTCRGSTCGTVNRTVEKSWITGNAMVVNCDHSNKLVKGFLYYCLLGKDLSICITGTGQPQIVRGPLANIDLNIPCDVGEQIAIAAALSDMDAEIADLEAQLDKSRALKQGMMQKLLTGEIRLI